MRLDLLNFGKCLFRFVAFQKSLMNLQSPDELSELGKGDDDDDDIFDKVSK
jgi:hypothetical protein